MKTVVRKNSKIYETMFVEGISREMPIAERDDYQSDLYKQFNSCRNGEEKLFACPLSDIDYTGRPGDECVVPIHDNDGFEQGFVVVTHCVWVDDDGTIER